MKLNEKSRSEWEKFIDEWIVGKNAERDKKILRRSMLDGIHFEPLAEEFDISVSQAKRIVHKRLNELFGKIE